MMGMRYERSSWAAVAAAALLMLSCGNEKAEKAAALVEQARALRSSDQGNRKDNLQKCRILLKKALALDPGRDDAEGLGARRYGGLRGKGTGAAHPWMAALATGGPVAARRI